jgi:hypothetical protein
MAHTTTAVRLFRRAWERHQAARTDFGDHGTAFGLDLSMAPADNGAEPPASERPPQRRTGFWGRLASRHRDPAG